MVFKCIEHTQPSLFIPQQREDCHSADRENIGISQRSCNSTSGSWSWPGRACHLSYTQTTAAFKGLRCKFMWFSSLRCWFPRSLQAWSSLLSWPTVAPSGGGAACTAQFSKGTKITLETEFCIHPASFLCPVQAKKKSLNKEFNPTEQREL